jgi:hypothetical protein
MVPASDIRGYVTCLDMSWGLYSINYCCYAFIVEREIFGNHLGCNFRKSSFGWVKVKKDDCTKTPTNLTQSLIFTKK